MALTLDRCLKVVEHAGYGSTSIPALDMVNEALMRLGGMHPWQWLHRPPLHLGVRGPVVANDNWRFVSGLTAPDGKFYSNVVQGNTDVALFNAYAWAPGDTVTITAGTGMVLRDYFIAGKVATSADPDNPAYVLYLTESPLAYGADIPVTDVRGRINANRALVLPDDFGYGLRAYSTANTLEQAVLLTSWAQLNLLRSSQTAQPAGSYLGALFWGQDESINGGPPRARLELWPYPTSSDPDLFTISYMRDVPEVEVDSDYIPLPTYIHPLFLSILREVVRGYEAEDEGMMQDRIDRIRASSEFMDAITRDGLSQPDYGPLRGGGEDSAASTFWPYPNVTVADP